MKNFYKIENNYPMSYQGEFPLDDTWKEFVVNEDGSYSPQEFQDAMNDLKAKEELDSKIQEAKAYLANTDYKMLPNYVPKADEDLDAIIAKRNETREFIRNNNA